MNSLWLITGQGQSEEVTLFSRQIRWELAEWCKATVYLFSFLSFLITILSQKAFIDFHGDLYLFSFTALATAVHVLGISFASKDGQASKFLSASYFMDAVVISCLIYVFSSSHSAFLLLGCINILLAAFVRGMSFAMLVAGVSAIFTNLFMVAFLNPGPEFLKSILIYNGAYFVMAILSGLLSDELSSMADIAESKSEDLKTLKNLNDLIVDNLSSGVIVVNQLGEVVRSNKGAMRVLEDLGLEKRKVNDVFPGIWSEIAEMSSIDQFDWEHTGVQGDKLLLEMTCSPLKTKAKSIGHILLFRDITEIRRLEGRMRQNEKLAAVGQLAAGIAHEIRNPLASISGSIQLLASTLDVESAEDKKLFSIILKEIDRLNDLISEFMDYVRPEIQPEENIHLDEILNEVLDMVKLSSGAKEVQMIRNLEKVPEILGHSSKLRQALLNIITNACQAMESSNQKRLEVDLSTSNNCVHLDISDSGVGISSENIHRIFEPFHTTKAKGTGLGLAITQKVIESHGAHMDVISTKGKGTKFHIEFPLNMN